MMTVNSLRLLFVLICCGTGYALWDAARGRGPWGAFQGFLLAVLVFALEFLIRKVAVRDLVAGLVGLFGGLLLAVLVSAPVLYFMEPGLSKILVVTAVFLIFSYLGIILAIKKRDELLFWRSRKVFFAESTQPGEKILDTSVIIDGRIGDLVQTKFLEGRFLLPRFILTELQQIADSPDPLKRNRGRRGLEVLREIQKAKIPVEILSEDISEYSDVDEKLVELAKRRGAKILTTDFNLNKVAELQGVEVLNVNDLAGALKTVVLPGEELTVKVVREGKEPHQGLAYLEDGTMIVVDQGRQAIHQTIPVVITSVLQTSAGRMIFAKKKEA